MPRYFFDLKNDLNVPDGEGRELAELAAAQRVAPAETEDTCGASQLCELALPSCKPRTSADGQPQLPGYW